MSRQASRGVPLGPRSVRGNAGRDAGNFVSPRETGSSVASPSRARFDSGHVWSDCRQNDPICIAPAQGLGRLSTNYGCAGGPKPAWPLTGVRFGPVLTHGVSTKLSRLPRRAAAARSRSSRACAYTRSVIAGSACPSLPATVRMSTPAPKLVISDVRSVSNSHVRMAACQAIRHGPRSAGYLPARTVGWC